MGYDPITGPTVSTPLDPHIKYSKEDCPQVVNVPLRDKVWAAHGKLIYLETWARPDLRSPQRQCARTVRAQPKLQALGSISSDCKVPH